MFEILFVLQNKKFQTKISYFSNALKNFSRVTGSVVVDKKTGRSIYFLSFFIWFDLKYVHSFFNGFIFWPTLALIFGLFFFLFWVWWFWCLRWSLEITLGYVVEILINLLKQQQSVIKHSYWPTNWILIKSLIKIQKNYNTARKMRRRCLSLNKDFSQNFIFTDNFLKTLFL